MGIAFGLKRAFVGSTDCRRIMSGLMVCNTSGGVGVDKIREQKILNVRKMLENRVSSPVSSAHSIRHKPRIL